MLSEVICNIFEKEIEGTQKSYLLGLETITEIETGMLFES
jgi:hypothetical protein